MREVLNIELFRRIISFGIKYIYALFSCLYLFLFGFFSSRNRELLRGICSHFGLAKHRLAILEVKLSDILDDVGLPVRIAEIEDVDGNAGCLVFPILALFVKTFKPRTIFEIGTFNGGTTLNLAINSQAETKIYTIDLPKNSKVSAALPITSRDKFYIDKNVTGVKFSNKDEKVFAEKNRIVQLYGDTATFDFSPYFGKIDMVFIDGAHSYEYVLNDSEIALKLLRDSKGVIIWHDYGGSWIGVTKALDELQSKYPDFKFLHIAGSSLICLILR